MKQTDEDWTRNKRMVTRKLFGGGITIKERQDPRKFWGK